MASSSSKRRRNYDVFLSFRGTDVRNNFLGHLYTALSQSGLYTYMDSEELRKGEQITSELMKAIDDSRTAIIIFSRDYPSSSWCLDELMKIMECKKQKDLVVLPVFYKVEPREVRTPRGIYKEAMAKHEIKFGNNSDKVKRWNEALLEAGSLSGWEFADGYEPGFIQDIVHEISTQLDRTPVDVAKYPIGIDSRVQELKTILNLQSRNDVLMIGLWGQGGVGKTTLAKAIYNVIFREFQGSCFLEGVRENSQNSNDLVRLQEKLLSEVLLGVKLSVHSVSGGSRLVQDRLSNKKVLIILDDVDDRRQLNALAGNCEWFDKGSRIIITTRDRHLLAAHGVDWDNIYEVKVLQNDEALELFRKHAFLRNQKIETGSELVDRVVRYAGGLPLALEVLGSFLCGRGEKEWKSTLQKLAKNPNKEINNVLKLSYDGLEDHEKEIFLDIACFFKGQSTEYITKVLDSCDFDTVIGIQVLLERSLISEEGRTLQMHDLIQSMGMDIVKEECRDDPGKRSRLWSCEDFFHVISENAETDAIKAIALKQPERKEVYIGPDAFTNMKKLRLLILINVDNSFLGPIHLPNELRWFEWPHCTSFPKFSGGPQKLVGLGMQNSKIEVAMEQFKDYKMVKYINFSHCDFLTCVPDLSSAPNLESLDLSECKSLAEVHQSVGHLDKLESLSLEWCSNLSIFPSELKTKSLQKLRLFGCSRLEKFPDILEKMERLEELHLDQTAIKELPASIGNLVSVKQLWLRNCKNLARLPPSIYKLQNLECLTLEGCSNFAIFPKNLEDSTGPDGGLGFPSLDRLDLQGCNLSELEFLEGSSNFAKLTNLDLSKNKFTHLRINSCDNLECLYLDECKQLLEIPQLPSNIAVIRANNCSSLQKLPDFSSLSNFSEVDFSSCCGLLWKAFDLAGVSILEYLQETEGLEILLTGEEMPEWIIHCKDGSVSFMVPKDLYDKFLGLALCVVLEMEEGKMVVASCQIQIFVNGKKVISQRRLFHSLESINVWLEYLTRRALFEVEKYLQNNWSHFQVCLEVSNASIKKWGFRLICQQQEDDLRVILQEPQPTETNRILEESDSEEDNSINAKEEDSPIEMDEGQRWTYDRSFRSFGILDQCQLIPTRRNSCPKNSLETAPYSNEQHEHFSNRIEQQP